MPELSLKVVTRDKHLANELRGFVAENVNIPGGATFRYKDEWIQKELEAEAPAILYFTLQFGSGVVASLVANWLVGKLKGRTEKLVIDRREIEINEEGEISRIIEEHIEKTSQQ